MVSKLILYISQPTQHCSKFQTFHVALKSLAILFRLDIQQHMKGLPPWGMELVQGWVTLSTPLLRTLVSAFMIEIVGAILAVKLISGTKPLIRVPEQQLYMERIRSLGISQSILRPIL